MKTIILENGQSLTIREAKEEDAQAIIEFMKAVGDESDNLTFSGSEFNETIEEEKAILRDHDEQENQNQRLAYF